jgi:alpha-tubulin suppressor-like RCC1 family protein
MDETGARVLPPPGLSNVVAIASGYFHHLALKTDGRVVGWGAGMVNRNDGFNTGQSMVPSSASNIVDIAAGGGHSMALDREGGIHVWGGHPSVTSEIPTNLEKVIRIACGQSHCVAVKVDGSVVEWGIPQDVRVDGQGKVKVISDWEAPGSLNNVLSVSAGTDFSVAIIRRPDKVKALAK